jgi:hypothetical protein
LKLGDPAIVMRCRSCNALVLLGVGLDNKPVMASIEVVDVARFIELRAKRVKFWHLDDYKQLVPLGPTSVVPMAEWRPAHPCKWQEPVEEPRTAPLPPCHTLGGPSAAWCQSGGTGATSCDFCDKAPFSPSRALDGACSLLMRGLGAVMLEREVNGRIVYRADR